MSQRYARQIVVPGIGTAGQDALRASEVEIRGEGLAAQVCAAYLAGAGVGVLFVGASSRAWVKEIDAHCDVRVLDGGGPLGVCVQGVHCAPQGEGAVGQGSFLARWALARILGGAAGRVELGD